MASLAGDLRFTARSLRRSPGFTVAALLTLTLGLGANIAIFSVVNGVLLRPFDFYRPAELVNISEINRKTGVNAGLSLADFDDWRSQSRISREMGAACFWLFNLTGDANPERLQGARVSARLFQVLGVDPVLGGYFRAEDGTADRGDLVVLSNGLWKRRFGGRQDILGRKLILNGVASTVIGVMPSGFSFPDAQAELWAPVANELEGTSRAGRFFAGVARIPSERRAAAKAELETVAGRLARSYPDTNADIGVSMISWRESMTGQSRRSLLILMGAVGFILLIACVNVANLGFARAATRGREVAIRMALGGSRRSIAGQILSEAVLLSAVGAALAWVLALAVVRGIIALGPGDIPRLDTVRLDRVVFAFTVAVALGSGILSGLIPALRASRQDVNGALGSGRSSTADSGLLRLRNALVVLEVAATMILLTGGGLLVRSFRQVLHVDLGYRTNNRLALRVFSGRTEISRYRIGQPLHRDSARQDGGRAWSRGGGGRKSRAAGEFRN
jgi:putative ABC transport system permease protein